MELRTVGCLMSPYLSQEGALRMATVCRSWREAVESEARSLVAVDRGAENPVARVVPLVRRYPALEHLDLSGAGLGGGAGRLGPEGAAKLSDAVLSAARGGGRLRVLILRDNALGDAGAAEIAGRLVAAPQCQLQTLNLEENGIGGAGMRSIALALLGDGSMTHLALSRNVGKPCGGEGNGEGHGQSHRPRGKGGELSGSDGVGSRAGAAEDTWADGGAFGMPAAEAFAEALRRHTSLRVLELASCGVTCAEACALAEGLSDNVTLEKLDLGRSGVPLSGAVRLLSALSRGACRSSLKCLRVGVCEGDGELEALEASLLPGALEALCHSETLAELRLEGDKYAGHGWGAGGGAQAPKAPALVVRALREVPSGGSIRCLGLRDSRIGPSAAADLALALLDNAVLTSLDLGNNDVGFDGAAALAKLLACGSGRLAHLRLDGNNLKARAVKELARALGGNATLKSLDLGANHMSASGAGAIAEALRCNSALEGLVLSSCYVGSDGAAAIADALRTENRTLKSIDLSGNMLGRDGVCALALLLRCSTPLEAIIIRSNGLEAKDAVRLAHALRENTALRTLALEHNYCRNEGAGALAWALMENRSLRSLQLGSNAITEEGLSDLVSMLRCNASLTQLTVRTSGSVSGRVANELARSLQGNSALTSLVLQKSEGAVSMEWEASDRREVREAWKNGKRSDVGLVLDATV